REPPVEEGEVADEALAAEVVRPVVDHHVGGVLHRGLTLTAAALVALAGHPHPAPHGAGLDAVLRVVGLAAHGAHLVQRVAARDEPAAAVHAIGPGMSDEQASRSCQTGSREREQPAPCEATHGPYLAQFRREAVAI